MVFLGRENCFFLQMNQVGVYLCSGGAGPRRPKGLSKHAVALELVSLSADLLLQRSSAMDLCRHQSAWGRVGPQPGHP